MVIPVLTIPVSSASATTFPFSTELRVGTISGVSRESASVSQIAMARHVDRTVVVEVAVSVLESRRNVKTEPASAWQIVLERCADRTDVVEIAANVLVSKRNVKTETACA